MAHNYPITQAIRFLREHKVDFEPHQYAYEGQGTAGSSKALGVPEHIVIKTLIFWHDSNYFIVLMHGDLEVSTKNLARFLGAKEIKPASEAEASKRTGYQFGGTSPFGTKIKLPIYIEKSILDLGLIYINGGKQGFLVSMKPSELARVFDAKLVEVGI